MIKLELTKEEVSTITAFPTIREKQEAYQKKVPFLVATHKKVVCNMHVRSGKTYCGEKTVRAFRNKRPNDKIIVVCNSETVQKQWVAILSEWNNIEIYIVNTYIKVPVEKRKCALLILDEIQVYLGDSEKFSQVIPTSQSEFTLGLSGTLPKDMLKKLEDYGFALNYSIPLELGYKMGTVPEYISYNVPVQLSDYDKTMYRNYTNGIKEVQKIFDNFSTSNQDFIIKATLFGKKTITYKGETITGNDFADRIAARLGYAGGGGWLKGKAAEYIRLVNYRMNILYECPQKYRMFKDFYSKIPNEKKLIFTYKTETADALAKYLPNSKCFHSKITPKTRGINADLFNKGELDNLVTCKSISTGFTTDCKLAFRLFFDSKSISSQQIKGRLLVKNEERPDEVARIITFYVDDFILDGIEVQSQEKKWLKSSQRGEMFVKWVNTLEEIEF